MFSTPVPLTSMVVSPLLNVAIRVPVTVEETFSDRNCSDVAAKGLSVPATLTPII